MKLKLTEQRYVTTLFYKVVGYSIKSIKSSRKPAILVLERIFDKLKHSLG